MNILSRLVNLVYPSKCSFCGKLISFQKSGINICSECMDKIKFCASRKRCKVCGTPLGNPRYRFCQSCFRKAKSNICTYYNGITAAVEYDRNSKIGLKGNSDNIQGKTILVIDDVTTTGATFNECARVLKLSGAKAVYCAAIATTEKNNGDRDSFT